MDFRLAVILSVCYIIWQHVDCSGTDSEELLLFTVATGDTDGFKRYMRSAEVNWLKGKVVGMGAEWLGGDMNRPGGGFKINLVKKEIEKYKDRNDLVILFTDAYDVLLLADEKTILDKFRSFDARVVFGAEGFCWPDASLVEVYPEVGKHEKRFLNSGGFIGYAKEIYDLMTLSEVGNDDDDQLYYTKIFLDDELRKRLKIKLDVKSELFHNLNGATNEVELKTDGDVFPYVYNVAFDIFPAVLHGNGPSKIVLDHFGNYVPKAWDAKNSRCTACREDRLSFKDLVETPQVVIAVFIERPTPFIEEFFDNLLNLNYSKGKIDLFIHNAVPYHSEAVFKFLSFDEGRGGTYHSVSVLDPSDNETEWSARNAGIHHCADLKCDYYLSVDANVQIDNPETLKLLIEQNRDFVAPVVVRPDSQWSNFWGALSEDGYYRRSADYMEIVGGERNGLWNVPFVSSIYLLTGSMIHGVDGEVMPNFINGEMDADMAFCKNLRELGKFMYASNREKFGHLVNDEHFPIAHVHNELWELARNRLNWEKRYLHPDYALSLEEKASEVAQPCPDVYWFPIVSDRFADELVAEMEQYGKWSNGSKNDSRISGGYENVPTRDIHMNQIGYEAEWLDFLDAYVKPLQEHVFIGYYSKSPPDAKMNFVVRYKPDEQPSLQPHQDSSTYTINIALNQVGVDYQGGGCHFLRYGCKVTATKKGWMMMHAGRLTHYHEGLPTTNGTRYIMISFVDP